MTPIPHANVTTGATTLQGSLPAPTPGTASTPHPGGLASASNATSSLSAPPRTPLGRTGAALDQHQLSPSWRQALMLMEAGVRADERVFAPLIRGVIEQNQLRFYKSVPSKGDLYEAAVSPPTHPPGRIVVQFMRDAQQRMVPTGALFRPTHGTQQDKVALRIPHAPLPPSTAPSGALATPWAATPAPASAAAASAAASAPGLYLDFKTLSESDLAALRIPGFTSEQLKYIGKSMGGSRTLSCLQHGGNLARLRQQFTNAEIFRLAKPGSATMCLDTAVRFHATLVGPSIGFTHEQALHVLSTKQSSVTVRMLLDNEAPLKARFTNAELVTLMTRGAGAVPLQTALLYSDRLRPIGFDSARMLRVSTYAAPKAVYPALETTAPGLIQSGVTVDEIVSCIVLAKRDWQAALARKISDTAASASASSRGAGPSDTRPPTA